MSSRYLKDLEARKSKIIHIYRNGDPYTRASFVILRLVEQSELERIIRAIEEKVKLPLNRPIRKLFEISGTIVQSPLQIHDGNYYVAASAEHFLPVEYGHPKNWILVGPVKSNKYENVHYVTRAEEEGKPTVLSVSNNTLSVIKIKNQNVSEKKSKSKKSDKLKKGGSRKKYAKNMIASEHADIILRDEDNNMENNDPIIHAKETDYNKVEHEPLMDDKKSENEYLTNENDTKEILPDVTSSEIKQESPEIISTQDEPSESIQENAVPSDIVQEEKENFEYEYKEESDEVSIACDDIPIRQEPISDNTKDDISNPSGDTALEELHLGGQVDPIKNDCTDPSQDQQFTNILKENTDEIDSKLPQDLDEDNKISTEEISDEIYNNAATKIQATFRGYQVRNEMGKTKTSDFPDDSIDENPDLSETTNIDDSL